MSFPDARPTTYRGIRMRSRLEARFAAYLDGLQERSLGWNWTYEPRAFANERGQYLPDFELDPVDEFPTTYVEVRPTVDRALLALERMQIIRSSEPDCLLLVVVGDAPIQFVSGPWHSGRWSIAGPFGSFNA